MQTEVMIRRIDRLVGGGYRDSIAEVLGITDSERELVVDYNTWKIVLLRTTDFDEAMMLYDGAGDEFGEEALCRALSFAKEIQQAELIRRLACTQDLEEKADAKVIEILRSRLEKATSVAECVAVYNDDDEDILLDEIMERALRLARASNRIEDYVLIFNITEEDSEEQECIIRGIAKCMRG